MAIPYILANAIRALIYYVSFALSWSCACVATLWFTICRQMVEASYSRIFYCSDSYHKILVIGDSIAEGFGDYLVCGAVPGVARRLERKIALSDEYRHEWTVCNRGFTGSCTRDWLPTAAAPQIKDRFGRMRWWLRVRREHHTLWKSVFNNPAYQDAEIVLVMLGSSDFMFEIDAQETCNNIIELSKTLSDMGKVVVVSPLPAPNTSNPPYAISAHCNAINNMLNTRCSELQTVNYKISFGDEVPHLLEGSSSRHPTSEGYKGFATEILNWLTNAMVAVEFEGIKRMLSPSPSTGTGMAAAVSLSTKKAL